jgi:hypothetical protein
MLEAIRQFGRKCLRESGEGERIVERHARYFLDLVENAFEAGGNVDWLVRTKEEYDNVRAVLERSIREGRTSKLACECAVLWRSSGSIMDISRSEVLDATSP